MKTILPCRMAGRVSKSHPFVFFIIFRFRSTLIFTASVSTLLAASIFWVLALAMLPHFHEEAHHDAHEPEHQCVVTLFQQGSIEGAPVVVHVPAPILRDIPAADLVYSTEVAAIFLLGGVLEHAPPRVS